MSVRIMAQAWATGLPTTETVVLLALADWADENGEAWPSVASIMAKTRLSERGVRNALRKLEAGGHLTTRQIVGRSARYFVHPKTDNPGTTCPPAQDAPGTTCPPAPRAETPAPRAPKPSRTINPQKASPSSGGARPKSPRSWPCPDGVSDEQWQGWLEHRRHHRKGGSFTQRAYDLLCKRLAELAADGHSPGEMIDRAIERGWIAVFPPSQAANQAPESPWIVALRQAEGRERRGKPISNSLFQAVVEGGAFNADGDLSVFQTAAAGREALRRMQPGDAVGPVIDQVTES